MANILIDKTNKVLLLMSLPISLGMLSTFLFQVIDTYFIGKLGPQSLAALSFSSTIYFVLVSLYIGLSIGVSIIIGKAVGAGEKEKINKMVWVSGLLTFLISSVFSVIGILFIDPIFTGLGASIELLQPISEYTIPILVGMPLLAMAMTASGVLRASGNITKPEMVMGLAGLINLIFDYALIFGKWGMPELGIQGAAYATIFSWLFVFIGMVVLLVQDSLIHFVTQAKESISVLVKEIFSLGFPTIITQIIGPFTMMFLTYVLAQNSAMAVAAFGVSSRIEMLLLIGVLSISTAITPFIAQNSGAKTYRRIDEAIVFAGKASTYLGIAVAILLYLFIEQIASIFTEDITVIEYTSNYFYMVSLSYVPYAFYLVTTSILNGLQQTKKSLKITLIKAIGFSVPATMIGSFWGVQGIFIGLSSSNVLAGIYAGYVMRKEIEKMHSALAQADIVKDFKGDFSLISRGLKERF